ncbi:hypothetical protein A3759_17815 [Thalassolituus sp. HI0120]|nr:hypothetical protein A3759_17815 [Thalassolituus sp. HI0120]
MDWFVSQVKIEHIQVGSSNAFYIAFDGEIETSGHGCNEQPFKNKAAMPLDVEDLRAKTIISLAASAQAQGVKVDIAGVKECSVGGYLRINAIRVGEMTALIK